MTHRGRSTPGTGRSTQTGAAPPSSPATRTHASSTDGGALADPDRRAADPNAPERWRPGDAPPGAAARTGGALAVPAPVGSPPLGVPSGGFAGRLGLASPRASSPESSVHSPAEPRGHDPRDAGACSDPAVGRPAGSVRMSSTPPGRTSGRQSSKATAGGANARAQTASKVSRRRPRPTSSPRLCSTSADVKPSRETTRRRNDARLS